MGFKEQFKNAVLNYLGAREQTFSGDREKFGRNQRHNVRRFGLDAQPANNTERVRAGDQARAQVDQKTAVKRHGVTAFASAGNRAGAQTRSNIDATKASRRASTNPASRRARTQITASIELQSDYKQQLRNAVLEYLSPEAYNNRLSQSADMVTKDQANRNTRRAPVKGSIQAGREIDDLAGTRSDRVSRVQRGRRGGGNSRLQRKGFDDKRAVGPNKPRPATLKLGKTLDIEEQFKNAVLKYLDENEEAGRKLTQARQQGRLKPGKLSKEDYEEGHTSHPEALRNRIRQSVANQAGRRASSKETNRLSKHQDIGGSVAAHHLTHGIKKSLEKDPSQGEGSDASKRTIDIAPMRSRRAHPQSGSMAQLDKHQKMARKRGEVAATQSTEDFHAGEEAAGATLNPKQASKAARSRTRTAAGEVRTAKHQAAQGTGAKTTKSSKNPAIRNAVRDEDRNTRDRRNTYGDTKQGYKDSTDFDPMNPFK